MIEPRRMRFLRRGLRIERARREAQPFAAERELLAGAQRGFDFLGVDREHHRRGEIVAIGVVGQSVVVLVFAGVRTQLEKSFGPAVALPAVVIQRASAQRVVGGFLIGLTQGCIDAEAPRVHILRVVLGQRLAHHLGGVFRMQGVFAYFPPCPQRCF